MPVLGVTGGIATGKSTVVEMLGRALSAVIFDADRCVHELLEHNPLAISAIRDTFGSKAFELEKVNRIRLRQLAFDNEANRKALEQILHPLIREEWITMAKDHREKYSWMIVDIPLLFETGAQSSVDRTLTVACGAATQYERLRRNRGLDDAMIEKIIGAQLPPGIKLNRADHVIWNDTTLSCLEGQAGLLARLLNQYYG